MVDSLSLTEGTILISRSGTIGNVRRLGAAAAQLHAGFLSAAGQGPRNPGRLRQAGERFPLGEHAHEKRRRNVVRVRERQSGQKVVGRVGQQHQWKNDARQNVKITDIKTILPELKRVNKFTRRKFHEKDIGFKRRKKCKPNV